MATTSAGCAICSVSLTSNPEVDEFLGDQVADPALPQGVNALVTACGHAFHAYCITAWMQKQPGSNGSCPNCRKQILDKTCSPLYLDICDISVMESVALAKLNDHNEKVKKELTEAKNDRDKFARELDDLKHGSDILRRETVALSIAEKIETEKYRKLYYESEARKDESLQKAQNELKVANENLKKVQDELGVVTSKLAEVQDELDAATYELEEAHDEMKVMAETLGKVQEESKVIVKKLQKGQAELEDATRELGEAHDEMKVMAEKLEKVQQESKVIVKKLQKGQAELEEATRELGEAHDEMKVMAEKLEKVQDESDEFKRLNQLGASLHSQTSADTTKMPPNSRTSINTLQRENETQKLTIQTLENDNEYLRKESSRQRGVIEKLRQELKESGGSKNPVHRNKTLESSPITSAADQKHIETIDLTEDDEIENESGVKPKRDGGVAVTEKNTVQNRFQSMRRPRNNATTEGPVRGAKPLSPMNKRTPEVTSFKSGSEKTSREPRKNLGSEFLWK